MDERDQFVVKQNNYGYTLLEMLISLTIVVSSAALTPMMFSVLVSTDLKPIHQQEISLFFEQTDKEIQGSAAAAFRNGKLYLTQPDGDKVTYEKRDGRVVRRVNGTGFEILLQNIHDFRVMITQHTVRLEIHADDDEFTHDTIMIEPFVNQWKEL